MWTLLSLVILELNNRASGGVDSEWKFKGKIIPIVNLKAF
jgi:hypothetical protein